jgi:hypothetical protein
MKNNRAYKAIKYLQNAPKNTLTLFELNALLHTDWSCRAINEARKIPGVIITGTNPYTLISSGNAIPRKPVYQFDAIRKVYYQI